VFLLEMVVFACVRSIAQHELANLADTSATPMPYSTYSCMSNLAKNVGGWDPDWISEDWHMFLKCFLHTGGRVGVQPILLPIVNYTPEDKTWVGTVWARWIQVNPPRNDPLPSQRASVERTCQPLMADEECRVRVCHLGTAHEKKNAGLSWFAYLGVAATKLCPAFRIGTSRRLLNREGRSTVATSVGLDGESDKLFEPKAFRFKGFPSRRVFEPKAPWFISQAGWEVEPDRSSC
jgi:hypothetical protein